MDTERTKNKTPDNLDKSLDRFDKAEGAIEARITDSLTLDGETHPTRSKVRKELTRLHVRRRKRKPQNPPN